MTDQDNKAAVLKVYPDAYAVCGGINDWVILSLSTGETIQPRPLLGAIFLVLGAGCLMFGIAALVDSRWLLSVIFIVCGVLIVGHGASLIIAT